MSKSTIQPSHFVDRTSSLLLHIVHTHTESHISIGEIIYHFKHRSFGFLLIMFCAIPALPIPAQGIATILSIPVLLLSLQMMAGKRSPWIPVWLAEKKIKHETLKIVAKKLVPYLQKFEEFSRPRFLYMTSRTGEKLIGFFTFLFSIMMALPIPLANMAPSIAIIIMSMGLIERDGLAIKTGIALGCLGLVIIATIIYFTDMQALTELWHSFSTQ